jgi:hypothetical protein
MSTYIYAGPERGKPPTEWLSRGLRGFGEPHELALTAGGDQGYLLSSCQQKRTHNALSHTKVKHVKTWIVFVRDVGAEHVALVQRYGFYQGKRPGLFWRRFESLEHAKHTIQPFVDAGLHGVIKTHRPRPRGLAPDPKSVMIKAYRKWKWLEAQTQAPAPRHTSMADLPEPVNPPQPKRQTDYKNDVLKRGSSFNGGRHKP